MPPGGGGGGGGGKKASKRRGRQAAKKASPLRTPQRQGQAATSRASPQWAPTPQVQPVPLPAQARGCKGRSPLHKKTIISPPSQWEGGRGSILPLRGRGATKQAKGRGSRRQRRQAAPPGTTAARSTGTARGKPRRVYGFTQARKSPGACILAGAGACMEGVEASYFMVTVPSAILYTPGQLTRLPQETVRRAVASTVTLLGA